MHEINRRCAQMSEISFTHWPHARMISEAALQIDAFVLMNGFCCTGRREVCPPAA